MIRKVFLLILSLSVIAMLITISISYSQAYTVTKLTKNSYDDQEPQINDNGYVVWEGWDGSDWEIFLYDGTNITQLTNNSYDDDDPKINNNGYVVWQGYDGSDWEIFLYNGTSTIQLTDNWYGDYYPQINDNGYVVWSGNAEIFIYNGTKTIQPTDNYYPSGYRGYNPQINDNGYVVWSGSVNSQIFLYNGTKIIQLTDPLTDKGDNPQINNNGYVVWQGYDGSDYEIFLYNGTSTIQLTDNSYYDWEPKINNSGYVLWTTTSHDIFLYNGTSTIQLTDNGRIPQINDNGYVVWIGTEVENMGIWLYNGTSTSRLTDGHNPQINNNGYVVWEGVDGPDAEIFLATSGQVTPSGGEVIPSGSIYTIQWSASGEAVNFKLKYSMNNGNTWKLIAGGITGASYEWTVPTPKKSKNKCLVKVIGFNSNGKKVWAEKSDAPFTIEVLNVTSPNGGETLTSGSTHTITWATNTTMNPVESVKLLYTLNGGATWKPITTITGSNPGSFDWTVPALGVTKSNCKVKVVLKDISGITVGSDASDSSFTIQPAP